MIYDVEHLFVCLFAIFISYLVRYLLRSLAHILISFFFPLPWYLKGSLLILDNSTLSDVSFTSIFSQSMSCLLTLLMLSLTNQKILILMKSSLSILSFMDYVFGVLSKEAQGHAGFHLCHLLRVSSSVFYI